MVMVQNEFDIKQSLFYDNFIQLNNEYNKEIEYIWFKP